jgi:prepilin-type N-terminal cleavage/methylation domain-containing protein
MNQPISSRLRKAAPGFSLIELMLAVSLLGTGLLAMAHLAGAVILRNGAASDSQNAVSIAETLAERMRDNRAAVDAGAYGDGSPPAVGGPDCARGPCTPTDRARWDLQQTWSSLDPVPLSGGFRGLLDGALRIDCPDPLCTANSIRLITISWMAVQGHPSQVRLVLTP